MLGLMQSQGLLIHMLLEHAQRHHGDTEIVSRRVEGDIHRSNWATIARRAKQVAHALDADNIPAGARIATLAWNGYRHLELYFGVSGSQRVLHTLNPRLVPQQLAWIINHAQDTVVCFDTSFAPLIKAVQAQCPTVQHWIALSDETPAQALDCAPNVRAYETWIAGHSQHYEWDEFDENTASSMCYTSGTTGNPKAALYSHRSTMLHAFAAAFPDALNLCSRDSLLPVVPMFHVNAWGIPYTAAAVGSKLVFPGPAMDGESIYKLIEAEGVTMAAGVPTVWQMLLGHMQQNSLKFSTLKRTVIGGSACPPAMFDSFEQDYDVRVIHAWGMTEMSPLGTIGVIKTAGGTKDGDRTKLLKQGRAVFGVDMKIVNEHGIEQPWDGKSYGDLLVKGPWVIDTYYKSEAPPPLVDGWFPTGDVATIDAQGFMQITDRSKDVIKSGGEWISSIDVENIAMAHPCVSMAACIGMAHVKWDERPIVVVVKKPGTEVSKEEVLAFFEGKIAKWQIPDDVVFVDAIPLGATGKMQKMALRVQLIDYKLPQD
jgi:fatty-acyl-CoA synthase